MTFDVTRDVGPCRVDVQNRVSTALGRLPGDVRTNGVTVQKGQTGFVLAAGIYSEKAEYDSLFISNYIDVYVKDALKRVPGVGDVQIFGERRYSMRVWLDPRKLASRALTAARRGQRAARAERAGRRRRVGQSPAPAGSDVPDQRPRRRPAARARRVREHHRQGGAAERSCA